MNSEIYYLIYFAFDNTFIVIDSDDVDGKIKNNQVKMKWDNSWYTGQIVYEGSEERCYIKSKKLCPNSTDLRSSGDESDQTILRKKRDLSNGENLLSKELSKLNRLQRLHQTPSTTNSQKSPLRNRTSSSQKRSPVRLSSSPCCSRELSLPSSPEINQEPSNAYMSCEVSSPRPTVTNFADHPTVNLNEVFSVVQSLQKDFRTVLDILNDFTKSIKKKGSDDEEWSNEVIYDDQNLLDIDGDVLNKYVISVMNTLFTRDELNKGLIKADGSKSKREKLDEQRVEILKEAVKNKFRIPSRRMAKTWREVVQIAKRCCYDSIKKKIKFSVFL